MPELAEMHSLGLLTWAEAFEANCYAVTMDDWMTMPQALMDKMFAAHVLMNFDHQQPHERMH
jgi:hypothetical protein